MMTKIQEPFSGFKDFAQCLAAQKKQGRSDAAASRICGFIKKKTESGQSIENLKFDEEGRLIVKENVQMVFEGVIEVADGSKNSQ